MDDDALVSMTDSLKAVLASNFKAGGLYLDMVIKEYKDMLGEAPNFRAHNFNSLEDLLYNFPDKFKCNQGKWMAVTTGSAAEREQMAVMNASCNKSKARGGYSRGKFSSNRGNRGGFGAAFSSAARGRGAANNARMPFREQPSNNGYQANGGGFDSRSANGGYDSRGGHGGYDSRGGNGGYDSRGANSGGFDSRDYNDYHGPSRNENYDRNDRDFGGSQRNGFNDYDPPSGERNYEPPSGMRNPDRTSDYQSNDNYRPQSVFDDRNQQNTGDPYGRQGNSSFDSYDSYNTARNSTGGYHTPQDEYRTPCRSEASNGGIPEDLEPPQPRLGSTARDASALAARFGNVPSIRREPSPVRRPPVAQPPPGLVHPPPPPGLESVITRRSVFDLSPKVDHQNTSVAASDQTLVEPEVSNISIGKDVLPPALEILQNRWPKSIDEETLYTLLADYQNLTAYFESYMDKRSFLMDKICEKANSEWKRAYIEYKRDKNNMMKRYIAYIPTYSKDDQAVADETIFRMTCQVLKTLGSMSLRELAERLNIRPDGSYAPVSFLFSVLSSHREIVIDGNFVGEGEPKMVSLAEGAAVPHWEIPADQRVIPFNSAGVDKIPRKDLIDQARMMMNNSFEAPRKEPLVKTENKAHSLLLRQRDPDYLNTHIPVIVTAFEDLTSFAIQTSENASTFKTVKKSMLDQYQIRGVQKPSYEYQELVVVHVNGEYYRAIVQEKNRRFYRVRRIDIGDWLTVAAADIYQFDIGAFSDLPALATSCTIGSFNVISEQEQFDEEELCFGQQILNKPVGMRIREFRENELVVDLNFKFDGNDLHIPQYFEDSEYISVINI